MSIKTTAKRSFCATWPEFFAEAFYRMAPTISLMVLAQGCREGWIQGELFRMAAEFGPGWINVNQAKPDFGKHNPTTTYEKMDLFSADPAMIGEIKIIGPTYQRKCLSAKIKYSDLVLTDSSDNVVPLILQDEHVTAKEFSLLKDVWRLKNAVGSYDRYMILLIPYGDYCHGYIGSHGSLEQGFGKALRAIQFADANCIQDLDLGGIWLRIWSVAPACPDAERLAT